MSAVYDRKKQLLEQFEGDQYKDPDALKAAIRQLWPNDGEDLHSYQVRIAGNAEFLPRHWKGWMPRDSETEDGWLTRQRHNLASQKNILKRSREDRDEENAKARERRRERQRKRCLAALTVNEVPQASSNGTQEHENLRRVFDLRGGLEAYLGKSDTFTLAGHRTTVTAFTPWLDTTDGPENVLYKEAGLVECLVKRAESLTEESNARVVVLEKVTDAEHPKIRRALAEGRVVYCDESDDPTENPKLTAEWLRKGWRIDTTVKVRQVHSMRNKAATMEPDAPDEAVQYLDHSVSIEDILTPTEPTGDHIYLLDMALLSNSPSPNLASLNDLLTVWQETFDVCSAFFPPNEDVMSSQLCQDKFWGLVHQAMTNTLAHHDSIGNVTAISGQAGYKIWFVFFHPDGSAVSRKELHRWQTSFFEKESVSATYPDDIIVEAFLIGPKTLLIQPPGIMHAVYTPVPAFTNGSSFCMYDTMHLTERSRFSDAQDGKTLTNVDHDDVETYGIFLRMMCGLRSFQSELFRKALIALALMVLFPCRYLSKQNHTAGKLKSLRANFRKTALRPVAVELACVLCRRLGIEVLDHAVVLGGHTKVALDAELKHLEATLVSQLDGEDDSIQAVINLDATGIRGDLVDLVERARLTALAKGYR